ncbi:Neurogenic locus Notch protein [Nymphon striatum]|nr:Neurogenic locus Notch protein [Nymphon striatum]
MYLGEYCQHVNPCHSGPGPRCQNGGTCDVKMSLTAGPQFSCSCPIGYSASLCEIEVPNSCESNPCQNGGTCSLLTLDKFICTCASGYRGPFCELMDHCASQPCRNGATCDSFDDSYKCRCASGFTGPTCTNDTNECKKAPCVHGSCINTFGSYRCACEQGYTGQHCETLYVPCEPSPCENGGSCLAIDELTYRCGCREGFAGINCEDNIDDCPGNLCQNGGTCIDGIGAYACQCPPTFQERVVQLKKNPSLKLLTYYLNYLLLTSANPVKKLSLLIYQHRRFGACNTTEPHVEGQETPQRQVLLVLLSFLTHSEYRITNCFLLLKNMRGNRGETVSARVLAAQDDFLDKQKQSR